MDTWPAETCLPKCPVSNRIVVLATLTWDERVRVGVFDTRFLTIYDPALRIYIQIYLLVWKVSICLWLPSWWRLLYTVKHLGASFGHLEKLPVEEHEVLSSIYGPDFEVGTRSSGEKSTPGIGGRWLYKTQWPKLKIQIHMGGWLVLPDLGSIKFPWRRHLCGVEGCNLLETICFPKQCGNTWGSYGSSKKPGWLDRGGGQVPDGIHRYFRYFVLACSFRLWIFVVSAWPRPAPAGFVCKFS